MLTGRRTKHVAIDWDRRQIRLVVFEYLRQQPSVVALHTVDVPAGVDAADPEAMGGVLKDTIERLSLGGAAAHMCVGRTQAVLKSLSLPPGTDDTELAAMVQFQIPKELPFAAEEAVVDFTRAAHWDAPANGAAEESTTVLTAAVRLPVIDAARRMCDGAGLKLQRLGLRPYANLRAVYRCAQCGPDERILLVSVTGDETEIDLMCDGSLEFSRSATFGSPESPDSTTGERRAARVRAIVAEVNRSLQSFLAVERSRSINACLVAGATGLEADLAAELGRRLGVACELFDPAGGFSLARGEGLSAFSAALGLAASPAREPLPLDFLSPKRPAQPRDMRKLRAGAGAAAAVLLAAGVVFGRGLYLGESRRQVSKLQEQRDTLKERHKAVSKLAKRVKKIEEWRGRRIAWLDHLVGLSNTLPGADRLYLTLARCNGDKINLTGCVKDTEVIRQFCRQLKARGYQVQPPRTSPAANPRFGYNFKFTLVVIVSEEAKPVLSPAKGAGRPADDAAIRDPSVLRKKPAARSGRGGRTDRSSPARSSRRRPRR